MLPMLLHFDLVGYSRKIEILNGWIYIIYRQSTYEAKIVQCG
jgi:hypothetical protein